MNAQVKATCLVCGKYTRKETNLARVIRLSYSIIKVILCHLS